MFLHSNFGFHSFDMGQRDKQGILGWLREKPREAPGLQKIVQVISKNFSFFFCYSLLPWRHRHMLSGWDWAQYPHWVSWIYICSVSDLQSGSWQRSLLISTSCCLEQPYWFSLSYYGLAASMSLKAEIKLPWTVVLYISAIRGILRRFVNTAVDVCSSRHSWLSHEAGKGSLYNQKSQVSGDFPRPVGETLT